MIEKFKSQVSEQGLARDNRWLVRVYSPKSLSATNRAISNDISKGGNRFDIDLPFVDRLDEAVEQLNNIKVDLGFISASANKSIPTIGFSLSNMGKQLESLSFFAETCSIPGRDMSNLEFTEYGESRSLGVTHTHNGIEIGYFCSENLRERLFFEWWQDAIFNPRDKRYGYYEDYTARIEIEKLDKDFNKTAAYRLNECYPTTVGALELQSGPGEVLRQNITFNFRNYERIY
jgi:hypothetical protein